jgi:hypothetical protein
MVPQRRSTCSPEALVHAVCHIDGARHPVTLTNASQNGCLAVVCSCHASPGDKVILRLTPLLAVPATIAWVETMHIGLKFTHPQHASMVEQFVAHQTSAPVVRRSKKHTRRPREDRS